MYSLKVDFYTYFLFMIKWIIYVAIPVVQANGARLIRRLTFEKGQAHWTSLTPSKRWSGWIIWSLVGVASFGIVWSSFAKIDESIQATGKLEPKGATKDVKAPLGGVIREILVRDGELVSAGQVLLELDTTAAKAKLIALKDVQSRVQADVSLSRSQLGNKINASDLSLNQRGKRAALSNEYRSRIDASRNGVSQAQSSLLGAKFNLKAKQEALVIREQILKDISPLAVEGAMARTQVMKEMQELLLLRGEVQSLAQDVARHEAALLEAKNRLQNTIALTKIDFSSKIEESEKQLAELSNQISESKLTLKYQNIRSPVSGIVFDLKPTSPGFVVSSEIPILKIVPTDYLVARVFISNTDIGFLSPGQPVQVRIDAFPSNEFGELKGNILSIGSDALAPDDVYKFFRFPVSVKLSSSSLAYKGRRLKLISGMSVTANIVLRQRPVISIFLENVLPFWDSLKKL